MSLWISDLKLLFKENQFLLRTLFLILILLLLYANALMFANGVFTEAHIFKKGFEIETKDSSVEKNIQTINYGDFQNKSA